MRIKTLELRTFRNIKQLQCHLDPNLNVFIGANAQGKTNLLESMAFLSSLRSFRMVSDRDLIQFGESMSRIQCVVSDDIMDKRLAVILSPQGKTLHYQNQVLRKTTEFMGLVNAVLFSPLDMTFFDDSPRVRRRTFDLEAGKLSRLYLSQMVEFNKLLKDRNVILKRPDIDKDLLDVITKQLIKSQVELIKYRRFMVQSLNYIINELFKKLSKHDFTLKIHYDQAVEGDELESKFTKLYEQSLEKDFLFKATQKGIHRDDFIFLANDIEVSKVASQGQKRLILLAFKLALVQFITTESQTTPILLLDDVLSELDIEHQKRLILALDKDVQTIITTTQSEVLNQLMGPMSVFEVKAGHISKMEEIK